ncbi:DNA mismatch repair protein [Sparassis crispa]|uniref:DNA mismatch repair protein MSH3 n=1 Tax=Sparassis crispa TaxID=139825 RepID=A0A401GKD1_9APHY|nr:DNA mismatch repair protein [Sparassis crispa]GBE82631.1 DNA mismatch repair protein [Sparassis crispa]
MSALRNRQLTSPKGQAMISSFFSPSQESPTRRKKRTSSPIDLTVDSGSDDNADAHRSKRLRTTSAFFQPKVAQANEIAQAGPSHTQTRHGGAAEQWRFDLSSSAAAKPRSVAEQTEQNKLHEKAKHILLGDSEYFSKVKRPEDAEEDDKSEKADEEPSAGDHSAGSVSFEQFMHMVNSSSASSSKNMKGKKKAGEVGPSGETYTDLELQVKGFKEKHKDAILMFQDGYRYRFFGEDAEVAAKELGVLCFPKRNFLTAMIPIHRQDVYIKKLLANGHKVGVVEQTETAALKKVSKNKSKIFSRELTQLYTAATYVDELDSVDNTDRTSAPPLMCLAEELRGGMGPDERVRFGMIVISPSTGDVVWDEFEDNHMRTELETRMVHIKPYEMLIPKGDGLSKPSAKMINHFIQNSTSDHGIRKEHFRVHLSYSEAFALLTKFYTDKTDSATASDSYNSGKLMAAVSDFPNLVVVALAHAIQYLSAFDVEGAFRETRLFAKFTERTHMLLNGNTLTNLEIYRNETDFTIKGSLMWILDHTATAFGARMLRSWVGRPLVDLSALNDRITAVQEILEDKTPKLTLLRQLLRRLPDLARGLCRIQYGKCTPQELAVLLPALGKVATTFTPAETVAGTMFNSVLLNDAVSALPKLKGPVKQLLGAVSIKMAKEGKKELLWTDPDKYPDLDSLHTSIQVVESELIDELKKIRKVVKKPALTYTTCAGEEYLVEINKSDKRTIPINWTKVSSTKSVDRFRTPEIRVKLDERARYKEALEIAANKAYLAFLSEITQNHYAVLRDAVNKLATADCLLSLAVVALQEGYVKPEFTSDDTLEISEGRHPMVEALRSNPFVPNSVRMGGGIPGSKIITGPNMGGKSSTVRMVALCAIMAQIGSYVPAKAMKIGLLDGILTRMGASDELARGRSTFMVEMQETSDIIKLATPRTLVILDELGRGTSTFDGMAIAGAVLQHLVQTTRCKTLFITHFPQVATDMEKKFPLDVQNLHMGYAEDTRIDGSREVTFLYKLSNGITTESFGVECARLAGVPESILVEATSQSENMRAVIEQRVKRNKWVDRLS